MPYRHEISDRDWARIKDMLPPENIGEGRHSKPNRDIGLSRSGRNTKIHAVVDGLGNPIRLYLTPGNVSDCTVAVEVLSGVTISDIAYFSIFNHIIIVNHLFCIYILS